MNKEQVLKIAAEVVLDLGLVWRSGDNKVFVGGNDAERGVWDRTLRGSDKNTLIETVMKHSAIADEVTLMVLTSSQFDARYAVSQICFTYNKPLFRKELKAEIARRGEGCMAVQAETKVMIWQREGEEVRTQIETFRKTLSTAQIVEFESILGRVEGRLKASEGRSW